MRTVALIASVVVGVAALVGSLLFLSVTVFGDTQSERIGGVIVGVPLAMVAVGSVVVFRRVRRGASPPRGDGGDSATAGREHGNHPTQAGDEREPTQAPVLDVEAVHILRPSRRKWTLVLLTCLAFTGVLVAMLTEQVHVIGVVGIVLFGGGVIVSIAYLLPGLAYLRIAPEGLLIRNPFGSKRYRWDEVENFTVIEIPTAYRNQKQVGFDLTHLTPEKQSFWQTLSRGVSGRDGALPDNYGLEHEQLADLLERYAQRYCTTHGPSASERADERLLAQAAQVDTSRGKLVTLSVCAICVAAFAWEVQSFGWFPSAQELRDAGGVSAAALSAGQWWTLFSAAVLHGNVVHIALNLIVFLIIGWLVEREIGALRMLTLVAVGAVCASGLAVVLRPDVVTVGLSGVAFAAMAYAMRRDIHRTRALGAAGWALLPINIIYTFLLPGISIGGHIGGLVAGLALAQLWERTQPAAVTSAGG